MRYNMRCRVAVDHHTICILDFNTMNSHGKAFGRVCIFLQRLLDFYLLVFEITMLAIVSKRLSFSFLSGL